MDETDDEDERDEDDTAERMDACGEAPTRVLCSFGVVGGSAQFRSDPVE